MRIIIETEDRSIIAPMVSTDELNRMEASNAGPPAATLLQSISKATSPPAASGLYSDATDAGAPSPTLIETLSRVP